MTIEDLYAIPEATRCHELIGGEIIEKAAPSGEHGTAQGGIMGTLWSPFQRNAGGSAPGGWWLQTETDLLLESGDIIRPDVVGWRRERCPQRPTGVPVSVCPDWICEVLSPSNANHDTVTKLRLYHQHQVGHYWLVDPRDTTLTVMRWSADGYVTRMRAERSETVRAEPFEAIELAVGRLFGDEPPA